MNRYCGSCGTPADLEDQFCPGCGKPMPAQGPRPGPAAPAYAPQAQAPAYAPAAPPPRPAYPPPPPAPAFVPPPPSFAPPAPPAPPKVEAQWYYAVGGKQQGPVAESVLRVALQNLPPETLVWRPGLPNWKTAEESGLKTPPRPVYTPPPTAPPAFAPPAPPAPPAYGAAPPPSFGSAASPRPSFPAPGFGPPAAAPVPSGAGPMPPNMHWLLLMILAWVTGGLAGLGWSFKEAFFVKKIDPASKAVMRMTIATIAMVGQVVLYIGALSSRSASTLATAGILVLVLNVVILIFWLIAVFSMRTSIERYYNSAEPIGLKLSGVMTFFFSILYFQYHFSRIAAWKQTGRWG